MAFKNVLNAIRETHLNELLRKAFCGLLDDSMLKRFTILHILETNVKRANIEEF